MKVRSIFKVRVYYLSLQDSQLVVLDDDCVPAALELVTAAVARCPQPIDLTPVHGATP